MTAGGRHAGKLRSMRWRFSNASGPRDDALLKKRNASYDYNDLNPLTPLQESLGVNSLDTVLALSRAQ
jgi:hypothetical protein